MLDRIFYVDRLPKPGETAIGSRMELFPGGKGANQALAARKLGADVAFISAVGQDEAADYVLAPLVEHGVNVSGVKRTEGHATSEAVISVDARGENMITACPGAYHTLSAEHLDQRRELFEAAEWLLVQHELPAATVARAIALGNECGLKVVFNPDPFGPKATLPAGQLHTLIPNEQQAGTLLGVPDYLDLSPSLRADVWTRVPAEHVTITLGPRGVEWVHDGKRQAFPAIEEVKAVDTVGAGDQFCGAYTAFAAEGLGIEAAVKLANLAAGLSVQYHGAQSGQRTRDQLVSASGMPA